MLVARAVRYLFRGPSGKLCVYRRFEPVTQLSAHSRDLRGGSGSTRRNLRCLKPTSQATHDVPPTKTTMFRRVLPESPRAGPSRTSAQTLKPRARSWSRPSSVIISMPHGGIQTQLITHRSTRPSSAV
jgi:hypothetical protein